MADKAQHSPTLLLNSQVLRPAHVILAGCGTVDTPHYRRIECGAVERVGSRDFDATTYTRWAWHGMAADSSHCILACFTVQAKTWPQC